MNANSYSGATHFRKCVAPKKIPRWPLWLIIIASALPMLACAIMGNSAAARQRVVITRLPTLTPTPSGISTPLPDSGLAPIEDLAPVATPVVEATPILIDIPRTNFSSETPGWTLTSGRIYHDQNENSLFLYGDIVNETGSVQEVTLVTGAFFDPQGQIIAGTEEAAAYLPVQIIPAGSRVPFELIVLGVQNISKVNVRIEAQPSSETPRQDFEFADLHETNENNNYCVGGTYRSQGGELQQYLVIVLVLYNSQDSIIHFADYYADLASGPSGEFEVCIETLDQAVARYELRAWGE